MRLTLTDQNFEEEVVKASSAMPVLVDFHADWCGPCKLLDPVLEELATEYQGKLTIGSLDVDANQQTAMKFGIMSIPTLIFFKNKQQVKQLVGFVPRESLTKVVTEVLAL